MKTSCASPVRIPRTSWRFVAISGREAPGLLQCTARPVRLRQGYAEYLCNEVSNKAPKPVAAGYSCGLPCGQVFRLNRQTGRNFVKRRRARYDSSVHVFHLLSSASSRRPDNRVTPPITGFASRRCIDVRSVCNPSSSRGIRPAGGGFGFEPKGAFCHGTRARSATLSMHWNRKDCATRDTPQHN